MFSIGAGVSVQKLEGRARLRLRAWPRSGNRRRSKADDGGYGFNVGRAVPGRAEHAHRRAPTARRSSTTSTATATFSGPAGAAAQRRRQRGPESAGQRFRSACFTCWSRQVGIDGRRHLDGLEQAAAARRRAHDGFGGGAAGSTLTTLPFNWKDTWRFGVGANYKMNDADEAALRRRLRRDARPTTPTARRACRIRTAPGSRSACSTSMSKQARSMSAMRTSSSRTRAINAAPSPASRRRLIGTFENKADILSVQYSHAF